MALSIPPVTADEKIGGVSVSDTVFGQEFNQDLVHQLVTSYLAGARSGTKAQKSRSQIRGGGKKPWRQKGTGHARSGTRSSPIWRSGGVTFAATPRSYVKKINKKMYRAGMRSILSELLRQERLVVTDAFAIDAPKTKPLVELLKRKDSMNALIVVDEANRNLHLATRNVVNVDVCTADRINPVNLINSKKVMLTGEAIQRIEERFG